MKAFVSLRQPACEIAGSDESPMIVYILKGLRRDSETLEGIAKESKVLARASCITRGWLIRHLLQLVGREVRGISDRAQVRNEGRIDLADRSPVAAIEERMLFDLVDIHALFRRSY